MMNKTQIQGVVIATIFVIGCYSFYDMYQDVVIKPAKKEQIIHQCAISRMGNLKSSDDGYNLLYSVNHANCEFEMMK